MRADPCRALQPRAVAPAGGSPGVRPAADHLSQGDLARPCERSQPREWEAEGVGRNDEDALAARGPLGVQVAPVTRAPSREEGGLPQTAVGVERSPEGPASREGLGSEVFEASAEGTEVVAEGGNGPAELTGGGPQPHPAKRGAEALPLPPLQREMGGLQRGEPSPEVVTKGTGGRMATGSRRGRRAHSLAPLRRLPHALAPYAPFGGRALAGPGRRWGWSPRWRGRGRSGGRDPAPLPFRRGGGATVVGGPGAERPARKGGIPVGRAATDPILHGQATVVRSAPSPEALGNPGPTANPRLPSPVRGPRPYGRPKRAGCHPQFR